MVLTFVEPPIAQDPAYHQFADRRMMLDVPNFLNVFSNVGFFLIGLWGMRFLYQQYRLPRQTHFARRMEIRPYILLFAGVMLTSFGSAYYHLSPDDTHLVWDRLPMTIGFMALFTATIMERISFKLGRQLLYPLILLGIASVIYWYWGDLRGGGDLRFYVDVQFYPMLAIPLMSWFFPSIYTLDKSTFWIVALYGCSKLFELLDGQIFHLTAGIISGHTLKHLTAALATYVILWSLQRRNIKEEVMTDDRKISSFTAAS